MGLETTAADALILLDTYFSSATSSSLGAREIAQGGRTEIIAACGFESYVPMCPDCGFTRAFAGELRRYAQMSETFNAVQLHHSVLDSLRWKSPVEGDCTSSTDRHGDASDICRDIPATLMYISLIRDYRVPGIPLRVMASNHIRMPPTNPSIPEAASTQLGPLTTAQPANIEQPAKY
jgi:hypothetical protein